MVRLALVNRRIARLPIALVTITVVHALPASGPVTAQATPNAKGNRELTWSALPKDGTTGPTRFQRLDPSHTGVDFMVDWTPRRGVSIQGINSTASCGGVCIGDYDGDGRPDIFLTRPFGGNRLYRNLGNFRFEDETEHAGLKLELEYDAWGAGPCFVDIDNDGDLDLYVCSHRRRNRLYINRGNGTFVEKSSQYGLDFSGASVTMAFADFDLDGDLDAYLVTNWLVPENEAEVFDFKTYWEFRDGRMRISKDYEERFDVLRLPTGNVKAVQGAQLDHFYRNDGGKFVEATREVFGDHAAAENFHGLAARWFDYDNDGYPDLYISNDYYGPDQLFHNNGNRTMTDVTKMALPHVPWYSMGSDAADVNNDGWMDFMASDMAFTSHYTFHTSRGRVSDDAWFVDMSDPKQQVTNTLYINTGTPRFIEAAAMAGVSKSDWTWAVKFGDLDNDGRTDLYITNGVPRNWTDSDAPEQFRKKNAGGRFLDQWEAYWKDQPPLKERNLAFRNLGDLRFQKIGAEWGLDFEGVSFGAALGDLDGDGDLDIVTVNFEDQVHIYRNEGGQNHRVALRLNGTQSNRMGIGTLVSVETKDGLQVRDLPTVRGFMSADEPKVYFGLGDADIIQRMTILWPSGAVQRFENVPVDRLYTITESASDGPAPTVVTENNHLFTRRDDLPKVVHVEESFDDFSIQPLLPKRLSRLGPGIACADVNGDGRDDFYLAGARGSIGQLLLGGDAGFAKDARSDSSFQTNQSSEELAPLFFDADGDGDQDLYVVNGGVETGSIGSSLHDVLFREVGIEPEAENLQDRLYLNEGFGTFVPAPDDALPRLRFSGSVAVAADFDRDGDLDLFVGGRCVPGHFPDVPRSVLLRNDGGRFVDVTEETAPGLKNVGLVTSAIWSDADGDGWPDLLVTCEWGPVGLWRNDGGHLADKTESAGIATLTGWWNGIAAGDLDHDGDIDYVVTNVGLNTMYRATKHDPAIVFYGDMDGDGTKDIIEAEHIDGSLYPLRDKNALTSAMPILAEELHTFREFAGSTLADLFGEDKLLAAKRLEATTFDSGVLINDGRGRFRFQALPRIAQVAPSFALAIVDVDADGHNDIYLVQNFYSSQPDTTRMDGGVSQLLLGDGKGGFRPVPPCESGLVVPGDAKAISVGDLNQDGRPDFLVTQNDRELLAFENQSGRKNRMVSIRLKGRRGNPTAVGARVMIVLSDGTSQTSEAHCGGSYLSQSSPTLWFGLGTERRAERVEVRWPDGRNTVFPIHTNTTTLTLEQPDS